MLKELKLQRFKKFEDLRVTVCPFTVLMGENSSGKTTVLQALNLALTSMHAYALVADDGNGGVRVRSKGVGITKIPGVELSDFRELYFAKRSRSSGTKKWVGANVELLDTLGNTYRLQLTSLFGSFNVKCNSKPEDLVSAPKLHQTPPLFISGFVGLSAVEECIFPKALLDRLGSGHVSSVIRNLMLDTKENAPEQYDRLKNRLERDFDFHLDKVLFNEKEDLYVTAQYSEVCDNSTLSLDFIASGSGFMQILQILAPIYRFCPDDAEVVLLDEPDAHLHPNLQTTLATSLRKIQQELNIQIIISTHSTSIIRAASPAEVVPITAASKVCRPLAKKAHLEQEIRSKLDSYSLAKSFISGKLIFFEDTDTAMFEEFDAQLNSKVFRGANTAPVIRGRGKTDRIPFSIKSVIKEIIGEDVEVVFIRDGDGLPPQWRERLNGFADKKKVRLIMLERFEMESYLLSKDLILRALKAKYPEAELPTSTDIEAKITEALTATITFSKYNYDDDLEEELNQAAQLIGLPEYRNPQLVKSEVRDWHSELEKLLTLSDLLKYGKGAEALSLVLKWLNDSGLNISKSALVGTIQSTDIPKEISDILTSLRSKEQREDPSEHPPSKESPEEPEDLEEKVQNLFFDFYNPSKS